MSKESTDAYFEIMSLLRRRIQLCDEWREKVRREHAQGMISTGESIRQMEMIGEEMALTKAQLKRMDEYVKNLKII